MISDLRVCQEVKRLLLFHRKIPLCWIYVINLDAEVLRVVCYKDERQVFLV